MSTTSGDHISANIHGDVPGQVAVGRTIAQTQHVGATAQVTDAERAELHELFENVKAQVAKEAPAGRDGPAVQRVEELEEALTAEEPDLTTAHYIKRWFLKNVPTVAGLITGVLVNPIVGKLVQSAGDLAATELTRIIEE